MSGIKQGRLFEYEDEEIKIGKTGINNELNFDNFENTSLLSQINNNRTRKETLKQAREYVWNTGLLYRLIKLKVDLICSGFEIVSKDEEVEREFKKIYKNLKMEKFIKNAAFEMNVIGEVYPYDSWKNGRPNNITLLNPELTSVKTLFGNDLVYMKPSSDIKKLLNSNDPAEQRLVRKYVPNRIIKQWEKGKKAFLENGERYADLKAYHEQYAHSPLEPIFGDLKLLSELISADYSVAKKMKQLIMHVKVGDKDFRDGKQVPPKVIDKVEELLDSPNGKAQSLYSQWFVDVDFVLPPIKEVFASDKYDDVVKRIIQWSGLGVFVSNESGSYASGYLQSKPAKQEIENYRNTIKEILNDFNKKIVEKNNMFKYNKEDKMPEVRFDKNSLIEETDMLEISKFLYTYGLMSAGEIMNEFGYDIERQMKKKEEEQEWYDIMDLPFEPSQGLTEDESDKNDNLKPEDENNDQTPRK